MSINADNKTEKPFHIVGVGGSAGGLHAFTELLKAIPKDTGMAFVFVQHLDPEQASHLSGILAKTTTNPVIEVRATTKLQANHIYTMPSDKDITITDGTLHLIKRTNSPGVHKPIDVFFTSLAKDQSELAVGVVLSGAGVDGTAGLKAIKANGGVTFAQDETAEYKDMPHSAVGAGVVDFVLPPTEVAQRIIQMNGDSTADEAGLKRILELLKTTTGIDFKAYKATTVQRRIWRRMALSDRKTLADYRKLLTTNPDELEALQKDMLIHVTSFFRDSEQFQVLKTTVFPAILNHRSTTEPINVWIPGCSSGEEVYSMAIALTEFLDGQTDIPFKILGTDISKDAIDKARRGLYQENIKEHVSPQRLRQFFTKVRNGYQVNEALLDTCQFLVQDVSDSPPAAKVNLISCQNVLIYLSSELQQKVFFRLHSVLEPDGWLVLGKSESLGLSTKLFREFDSKHKIYTKVTTGDKQAVGSGVTDTLQTAINTLVDIDAPQSGASEQVDRQQKIIKLREALSLTQEYADSIIGELDVMNEAMQSSNEELMTISEESQAGNEALKTLSKELETRNEEITLARDYAEAIIKTVREPLIILDGKLRVKSASKSFYTTFKVTPEQTENILLYDLGNRQWNIPVLRTLLEKTLPKNNTLTDYEVVHDFRDIGRKTMLLNARTLQQGPDKMPLILLAIEDITDRKQAEEALVESEDLFRTANEKMTILNEDLQTRTEEVIVTRDYADAIIRTVRGPLLVLSKDLRIISANEAFYNAFKVAPLDTENRLLYDLGNRQWNIPGLKTLLEKILPKNNTLTDYEVVHDFRDIGRKTMLLNARTLQQGPDKMPLILLAIEDITDRKQAEEALVESEDLFRTANEKMTILNEDLQTRTEEVIVTRDYADAIIRTVRGPLLVLSKDLRIISANEAFYNAFKVAPDDTENRLLYDLGNRQWNIPGLKTLLEKILPKNNTLTDYEVVHDFRDIGRKTMLLNARTLQQGPDKMPLILLAIEDITDRKQLEQQKDEFMRIASHELKTPVTSIKAYAQIMQRRFERKNDDESAKNMARMNAQLDKLTGLIGDLLDVTKIEAGKMQFQLQSFDFDALVTEIAETMQLTSEQHNVIVKGRAGKPAWGDRERTGQVLINLIGNAIKYSPHSGKITVSVKSNDTEITTSVRDFGLGISHEKQEEVFERFFRVSGPSMESFSGLGLGLYISAEIVRRLGGKIWVKSTTGKGSTFSFTLPVKSNVKDLTTRE